MREKNRDAPSFCFPLLITIQQTSTREFSDPDGQRENRRDERKKCGKKSTSLKKNGRRQQKKKGFKSPRSGCEEQEFTDRRELLLFNPRFLYFVLFLPQVHESFWLYRDPTDRNGRTFTLLLGPSRRRQQAPSPTCPVGSGT